MNRHSETISLESINRHLPLTIREAQPAERVAYIRKKRSQFLFLSWIGVVLGALIAVLTVVTFFLPNIEAGENLLMSIIIVVFSAGSAIGNRKMAQRYGLFESRLAQEPSND